MALPPATLLYARSVTARKTDGADERLVPTASAHPLGVTRLRLAIGFAVIYVVWGSTYLAIRVALANIPPFVLGSVRFLVAGGGLYAWSRWRGAPKPTGLQWRNAAIVGGLLLFIGNGAVSWSEQRVSSGMTSLLVATVPLWLVLSEAVRGNRPTVAKLLGVAAGLVGVGLLVLPVDGDLHNTAVDPIGAMVLSVSALSWTIGSLFSRQAVLAKPASMASAMQMLVGGTLLLALSLVSGEAIPFWSAPHVTTASVLAVVYLIVFGSLVGFSTYMWLLSVASPTAVGTYAYVNPVVAVILGVLLLGETLPPRGVLAMFIIVGSVALVSLAGQLRKR